MSRLNAHSFARPVNAVDRHARARGFTLIELVVTIAIVAILISLSTFVFRGVRDAGTQAEARNALLSYAAIARNYAVEHHIETMFVVNPHNGRFEIWHLNPPAGGGPWDPFSGGTDAPFTDGYAYAPILDKAAGLPLDGQGRPRAMLFPVDFDTPYRPTNATEDNVNNFFWAALCFDENGRLVTRTRRIATRSTKFLSGTLRNVNLRNRLPDETPNLAIRDNGLPLVTALDTPITSTRGFIICDWVKAQTIVGTAPTPVELVNGMLIQTRADGKYRDMAEVVLFDRFSGQPLMGER